MTSTDNKNLFYDALKTLNAPTEDSKSDVFNNNDGELYVPESFSAMFGDIVPEQDFQDVIDRLHKEKQNNSEKKVKDGQSENSSDEGYSGVLNKVKKLLRL